MGFIRELGPLIFHKYAGKMVYLSGKDFGFPGIDLQFNENGRVLIHNSSEEGKGFVGGVKTFSASLEYPSGIGVANLRLKAIDGDKDLEADILREVQVSLAVKNSSQIVPIQRFVEIPDIGPRGNEVQFFQSPLMEGSLTDLLKTSKDKPETLSWENRAILVNDIYRGMRQMHDAGFVHRDIKPDNFLILKIKGQYRAFLSDFDKAVTKNEWKNFGHNDEDLIERRAYTPNYESPETFINDTRAIREDKGLRADEWANALTGLEILSNKPPTAWTERSFNAKFRTKEILAENIEKLRQQLADSQVPDSLIKDGTFKKNLNEIKKNLLLLEEIQKRYKVGNEFIGRERMNENRNVIRQD